MNKPTTENATKFTAKNPMRLGRVYADVGLYERPTIAERLFRTYSSQVALRLADELKITHVNFSFYTIHVFSDGSALAENVADGAVSVYHGE